MTTTASPAPHLLHYGDQVVPWVSRWTGEVQNTSVAVRLTRAGAEVAYEDGNELRGRNGVLWQREGIDRSGEPMFGVVNTHRQAAALRKLLCDVCGRRIDGRPISWLVPDALLTQDGDDVLTTQAPTCPDCEPIAMSLCPFLGRRTAKLWRARVIEHDIFGVSGFTLTVPEGTNTPRPTRGLFPYADYPSMRHILAQQEVVRFTKFTITEVTR